jgi:hypothetical protein
MPARRKPEFGGNVWHLTEPFDFKSYMQNICLSPPSRPKKRDKISAVKIKNKYYKLHRIWAPALIDRYGNMEWFLFGKKCSEKTVNLANSLELEIDKKVSMTPITNEEEYFPPSIATIYKCYHKKEKK